MKNKQLLAGAAKVCITPPAQWLPLFNKRNFLGGGPDSYFGSILDDLYVKSLILDNGIERLVIVVFDLIALPYPVHEMREIAAQAAGVSVQNVLFTCTHTHNAISCENEYFYNHPDPVFRDHVHEYLKIVRGAIKTVVENAVLSLQPAKVGFGKGESYVNCNRHVEKENGKNTIAGFERDRVSDRELSVLRVDALNGTPICFLFNYACHASLLANNKPVGEYTQISSDLAGNACRKLEEMWDNKPIAIYTPGSGGDQNAVMIARVYDVLPDASSVMHDFGAAGPVILDFMADKLAHDANKVVKSITDFKEYTKLWATKKNVKCSGEALPLDAPNRDDFIFEFTLFMLGDIALAASNGEIYSAIGMRIKDNSPYRKIMYINIAGPMFGGYIKDDSGHGIAEGVIRESLYAMMENYSDGLPGTME